MAAGVANSAPEPEHEVVVTRSEAALAKKKVWAKRKVDDFTGKIASLEGQIAGIHADRANAIQAVVSQKEAIQTEIDQLQGFLTATQDKIADMIVRLAELRDLTAAANRAKAEAITESCKVALELTSRDHELAVLGMQSDVAARPFDQRLPGLEKDLVKYKGRLGLHKIRAAEFLE